MCRWNKIKKKKKSYFDLVKEEKKHSESPSVMGAKKMGFDRGLEPEQILGEYIMIMN